MIGIKQSLHVAFLGLLMMTVSRGEAALEEIINHSEWWPDRVTVTETIEGPLNKQAIKPGRLGFVIRVEGDEVLVDYGRFGVVRLPIAKTNFLELGQDLKERRGWSDLGIWTAQLHTKLLTPTMEGGFTTSPLEIYDPVDYFIIVYLDTQTAEGQKMLDWMSQAPAIADLSPNQMLAMIPSDKSLEDLNLELIAYDYPGYTLAYPMADPYRKLLNQEPGVAALAVIDKNGREISSSMAVSDDTDLNALFDELQRRISQDEERRRGQNISETE